MKIIKIIQSVISFFPIVWVFLFVGFIVFPNNLFIAKITFFYLFFAFHSIWILLFYTLFFSIIKRRLIYEKFSLIIFFIGSVLLLLTIFFDPGGYFSTLIF